jgi:hypothetical protein
LKESKAKGDVYSIDLKEKKLKMGKKMPIPRRR